jgi:hypothetical protein
VSVAAGRGGLTAPGRLTPDSIVTNL